MRGFYGIATLLLVVGSVVGNVLQVDDVSSGFNRDIFDKALESCSDTLKLKTQWIPNALFEDLVVLNLVLKDGKYTAEDGRSGADCRKQFLDCMTKKYRQLVLLFSGSAEEYIKEWEETKSGGPKIQVPSSIWHNPLLKIKEIQISLQRGRRDCAGYAPVVSNFFSDPKREGSLDNPIQTFLSFPDKCLNLPKVSNLWFFVNGGLCYESVVQVWNTKDCSGEKDLLLTMALGKGKKGVSDVLSFKRMA